MQFDVKNYTDETLTNGTQTVLYRAYRDISYVEKPVSPEHQILNIFIPQAYIQGEPVGNYTSKTAPIFFPNGIGGYMDSKPCSPAVREDGTWNTEAKALLHGYVVISAGARGKNTCDGNRYIGKAPSCIVDQKAAIRFIRSIADQICGDARKIISNGTSAGGAVSALLGATGDAKEYLHYLEELGAADTSDRIFASSCYCPITNLDHSDMAYEWQFGHLIQQHYDDWSSGKPVPKITDLNARQLAFSEKLAMQFVSYLDSVGITEQSLLALIEERILDEAKKAASQEITIPPECGISDDYTSIDFRQYCTFITRMKPPCCFDNPDWNTWENELFGTEDSNGRHFTDFAFSEDTTGRDIAPQEVVKLMNPLYFLSSSGCVEHWRIRHGAADRDTSFAVSAILTAKLREQGCHVDYALPWNIPHSGDYDLPELFTWIDAICNEDTKNDAHSTF